MENYNWHDEDTMGKGEMSQVLIPHNMDVQTIKGTGGYEEFLGDLLAFLKETAGAFKAVTEFDAANADPKLIKQADKLYGSAHDDMEALYKKSKVVHEMAEWNKSVMGK